MTVEQLRNALQAQPFRPFNLRMADGRALLVPHKEFLTMSPGGRTIIVFRPDESFSIVDLLLVNELDGLAAASHYAPLLPHPLPCFRAEIDRLPFGDEQSDSNESTPDDDGFTLGGLGAAVAVVDADQAVRSRLAMQHFLRISLNEALVTNEADYHADGV